MGKLYLTFYLICYLYDHPSCSLLLVVRHVLPKARLYCQMAFLSPSLQRENTLHILMTNIFKCPLKPLCLTLLAGNVGGRLGWVVDYDGTVHWCMHSLAMLIDDVVPGEQMITSDV